MKYCFATALLAVLCIGLFCGCATVPEAPTVTDNWQDGVGYILEQSGMTDQEVREAIGAQYILHDRCEDDYFVGWTPCPTNTECACDRGWATWGIRAHAKRMRWSEAGETLTYYRTNECGAYADRPTDQWYPVIIEAAP